jgi:hypothetical protein
MGNEPTAWRRRYPAHLTAAAIAAAALACVASVEPAFAQARTATTTLSCSAAAALVTERGAIVLSTGPTTYDRFVAGGGACDRNQTTEPAYEGTADVQQCFIGYRCRGRTGGGGNGGN